MPVNGGSRSRTLLIVSGKTVKRAEDHIQSKASM
jgi:hypothetical protein